MLKQHAIDNAESDEEFVPLEIRQKIMDFYALQEKINKDALKADTKIVEVGPLWNNDHA